MLNRTAVVFVVAAAGAAAAAHADIVEQGVTEAGQGMDALVAADDLAVATITGHLMDGIADEAGGGEFLLGSDVAFSVELTDDDPALSMVLGVADVVDVAEFAPMRARSAMSIESIFTAAGLRSVGAADDDGGAVALRFAVLEAVSAYDSLGERSGFGVGEGWFDVVGPGQAPLVGSTLSQLDSVFGVADLGGRFGGAGMALGGGGVQDMPTAVMADRAIPAPGSAAAFGMGVLMMFGRRRR